MSENPQNMDDLLKNLSNCVNVEIGIDQSYLIYIVLETRRLEEI